MLYGLLALQLVSCNNTDTDVTPIKYDQDKVNMSLVEEVKRLPNEDAQKMAFTNILNSDEQYYIFYEKTNSVIQNSKFNSEQKRLFSDLLDQFSPKIYSDPAALKSFGQFADRWFARALSQFSKEELYLIVGTLSLSQSDLDSGSRRVRTGSDWIVEFEIPGRPSPCKCSKTSDFCPARQSCQDDSCGKKSNGCGLFWANSCDGGCKLP